MRSPSASTSEVRIARARSSSPNDHVDVIRIFKDPRASKSQGTEVDLQRNAASKHPRTTPSGPTSRKRTADASRWVKPQTLELDPDEVDAIALAQRSGTLTLALRSVADVSPTRIDAAPEHNRPLRSSRGSAREEYSVFQAREQHSVRALAAQTPFVRGRTPLDGDTRRRLAR